MAPARKQRDTTDPEETESATEGNTEEEHTPTKEEDDALMRALLGNVSRLTDSSSCSSSRSSSRDRSPSAESSSSCSSCSSSSSSSSPSSRTSRSLASGRQRPQPTQIGYYCQPKLTKFQRFERPNSDACSDDKSFKRTATNDANGVRKRKKSVADRVDDNDGEKADEKKNTCEGEQEEHEEGELCGADDDEDDDRQCGKEEAPAKKKRKSGMWIQSETVSVGRPAQVSELPTTPTPSGKEKRSVVSAGGCASSHLASAVHVVSNVKNRPTGSPSTTCRPPFPPHKIPLLPRNPVATNGMDKDAARNSRDACGGVCGEFGVDDKKWIDHAIGGGCDRGAGSGAPHPQRRHFGPLKFCNERVFSGLGGAMLRGAVCVRDALKIMFKSPIYYVEHLQKYVRWLENECRKQLLDVVVTNEVDGHIVDDAIAVVSAIIELVCFLLHVASRRQRQWAIACRGMTTYSCFSLQLPPPPPPPLFTGYASGTSSSTPSSLTPAGEELAAPPQPNQNSPRCDEHHRFSFRPAHFYTDEDIACYELDRCDAKMFLDFVVEPWACVLAGKIPALSHLPLVGGRQPISAISARRLGGVDDNRAPTSRPNMYGHHHHHQTFRVPRPHPHHSHPPPPHHPPPAAAAAAAAAPQPTHLSHQQLVHTHSTGNVGAAVASWNGNRRPLYRGVTRRC